MFMKYTTALLLILLIAMPAYAVTKDSPKAKIGKKIHKDPYEIEKNNLLRQIDNHLENAQNRLRMADPQKAITVSQKLAELKNLKNTIYTLDSKAKVKNAKKQVAALWKEIKDALKKAEQQPKEKKEKKKEPEKKSKKGGKK